MPPRSRSPSPVMCRDRERSPTIWPATIRRTRRCNSCISRRCGPCSHWTHVIRQRRFNRCRRPPATISPWAASASVGTSAGSIRSTFAAWRIWRRSSRPRPPPSSSGLSTIAASCSSIPWTRWRGCSWRRALALSGDTVKAKSAYSDLLTLWKNADPDIPVLKEARAEYARLP